MKSIKKGRYYWHRDSSKKGFHPSLVYKKNDKKNKYNIVCFTSSKGKHRTKLKENINPSKVNEICYVLRNPSVVKRKAIGQEINGYKITNKKDKALVKFITRKKN